MLQYLKGKYRFRIYDSEDSTQNRKIMDREGLYQEKDAWFLVHSEIHCNQVFLTDVEVLQRRIILIL